MLFKWSSCRARTYVRARGRSRTILANERKRKHTRTQINARKLIVAMDVWVISACKRDCDLRVRSKTFRMYYMRKFNYKIMRTIARRLPCTCDHEGENGESTYTTICSKENPEMFGVSFQSIHVYKLPRGHAYLAAQISCTLARSYIALQASP